MLAEQNHGRRRRRRRYLPSEIVEEILVNLSVKSLVRFSSVSKSWNSMIIYDQDFIRRHAAATASRNENIRIVSHGSLKLSTAYSCRISSCIDNATPLLPAKSIRKWPARRDRIVSSYGSSEFAASIYCHMTSTDNATPLIFPFKATRDEVRLLASCGELWCVYHANSIFLWNPSTTSYKKLPQYLSVYDDKRSELCFGLGYDSLSDDYKIVKIYKCTYTQVYSLRSDSWRRINEPFPFHGNGRVALYGGVACNGALHWVLDRKSIHQLVIISFDLSTEKYGEVTMPRHEYIHTELAVLREKLCMYLNSFASNEFFVLWEMQEYGVVESWTKTLVISHRTLVPAYYPYVRYKPKPKLYASPLYFYDDGRLLIKAHYTERVSKGLNQETLFIYKDDKTQPQTVLSCRCGDRNVGGDRDIGHLYLESLVSPTTYCTRPQPPS